MSEAVVRVITGIIGAPIVLAVVYLGGWPLGLLVLAAAAAGQFEVYRMMKQDGLAPLSYTGYVIGGLTVLAPLWTVAGGAAVLGLLVLLAAIPFRQEEHPLRVVSATVLGILYPVLLLSSALYLREGVARNLGDEQAFALTGGVLVLVWAADTGAYYVGKRWGKHPLAPRVSPKKTWEGLAGGAAGALLAAAAVRGLGLDFLSWGHLTTIAVICALCSPIGDLLESKFKRSVGVKDAGALLPGHGGIMDRIDGLILSLPVVALYTRFVAGLW